MYLMHIMISCLPSQKYYEVNSFIFVLQKKKTGSRRFTDFHNSQPLVNFPPNSLLLSYKELKRGKSNVQMRHQKTLPETHNFEIDFEKWLEFYVTETDKKEIQDRMKTINKKKKARHV